MTVWIYTARQWFSGFFGVSFVDELILISLNHEIWVSEIDATKSQLNFPCCWILLLLKSIPCLDNIVTIIQTELVLVSYS